MKYHQILATLTEEPLLIAPSAHASLLKLFDEHRNLSAEEFKAKREGVDWCGEEVELEQAELVEGIMMIPIRGPIGRGLGKFERGAGAVDVGDIEDELDQLEDDPNCKGAVLLIDSPGGMVSGTPELADRIVSLQKPIYAFTPGMACSAAYWIGCSTDGFFATRSADIGSIGVYAYWLDSSKRYEAAGVKAEVVSSGQFKGMLAPGTSITKAQRDHMQERINDTAEMFYRHVEGMRPDAKREDMQGQAYKAHVAMEKGLIDGVVSSLDDVLDLLR